MVQQQSQQQQLNNPNRIQVQTSLSNGTSDLKSSSYNLTLPREKSASNSLCVLSGEEDNLSLAVENGTSYNSSRNELDNLENDLDENGGMQTDAELEYEQAQLVESDYPSPMAQVDCCLDQEVVSTNVAPAEISQRNGAVADPNSSVICETINDFCARHTREKLESLVNQVGFLSISDCYFSERSSTLCMVIEVKEK